MGLLSRVVLIVAVALLPALGMEVYDQRALRAAQRAQLHDEAVRQARSVADEMGRILDGTRNALLALAMTPAVAASDAPACQTLLERFRAQSPYLRRLALVNMDNRVVCGSEPGGRVASDGGTIQQADWLHVRAARQRGGFVATGFLTGGEPPAPLLATAMPLPVVAPSPAARSLVLVAEIDLSWLNAQLRVPATQGGANITVIDRGGRILVSVPEGLPLGSVLPDAGRGWLARTEPGADPEPSGTGRDRMVGIAPLTDLVVAVRLDQSTAAAAQDRAARRSYVVSGVGLLGALLLAVLITQRSIGGPIDRITRTIARWRAGDIDARVEPAETRSEFGRIGAALDELLAAVARTEGGLRLAKTELEARVAERTRRLLAEVREREAVQAQLLQAQKMEVVGQLTGGVAHDFNNLLTAVIGNIELAMLRSRGQPELVPLLAGAMRAAERGAALTQRMLAFGRRQFLRLQPVALGPLLDGMQDLLTRTIGPTVRIEISVAPDLWPARADPNQLELVLLNLAINARDAMPGGGTLRLLASPDTVAAGAAHPAHLASGDYVCIAMHDEGGGIAPDVLSRVLEPFFTTKPAGKGSGLGLSMAHGVAVQSGGGLAIDSVMGEGTTVSLWLPRDAGVVEPLPTEPRLAAPVAARSGPGLSILLVDDDVEVAEVSRQLLQDEGFTVTHAEGAEAALALLDAGLSIDLLIADIAMPDVNGLQLADLARTRRPGLLVLLATGYAQEGYALADNPGYPVLRKPFRAEQLLAAVRGLLNAQPPTGDG